VTSRLSDQDQADAQRLQSRRVLLAFRRGSDHQSPESEPHPGRALLAGLVLAALATLIAGVVGLTRGGPPKGWDREGNVVIDDENGTLYIIESGALRQVANETSLRLAYPSGPPTPVRVDGETIASRPHGATFGRADLPARPPTLAPASSRLLTCAEGNQSAVIVGSTAPPADQAVAVVNSGKALYLVAGPRLHRLADLTTVSRLGYPVDRIVKVPPQLLTVLSQGPLMAAATLPRARPLPAGAPPWLRTGSRVTDTSNGRWYLAVNGVLRPVANQTALNLIFGTRLPGTTRVPPAVIRAQRVGKTIGTRDTPDRPPKLTNLADRRLCADEALRSVPTLPISGLASAPVPADSGRAVIWTPPDGGTLVAASKTAATAPSATDPVLLLAQGRAFPIESVEIMRALGYTGKPVTVMPKPWLDALPIADPLREPS
jgi:hypothetical protein